MTTEDVLVETAPAATLAQACRLALIFALIKLAIHVCANLWQAHLGWGYYRDELYYIMCGQRLDWGYVDHGPIVALQARLALILFGKSLAGIRTFSALAGAMKIFLTGLLAWQFGASHRGQAIAMFSVLLVPEFLALDSYLSMNSFEPVFWMTAAFAILRVIVDGRPGWWLVFGLAAGLGCENKPSMVFFLAALLLGLLVSGQRRILFTRGAISGVLLAGLLEAPNVIWQAHHGWATLHFLHNTQAFRRSLLPTPASLLLAQVVMLNPVTLPFWLAGLVWLVRSPRARSFRFAGYTYLFFLAIMMISRGAREYYLAPIYPLLFAAGGCAWESLWLARRTRWIIPAYASVLLATGLVFLPLTLPVLRPQQWLSYVKQAHLRKLIGAVESGPDASFNSFYAFRFGWQEMTDDVTRVFRTLSPADQAHAGIYCRDYGAAGAINFLGAGRGLPIAVSGHNNFYFWGPQGETGEVMIEVTEASREELLKKFTSVELVGAFNHPYEVPNHVNIYLCRHRQPALAADWTDLRHYD